MKQLMTAFHLTADYAWQIKYFDRRDWLVYVVWVGLMLGLLVATGGFVLFAVANEVSLPPYVWNIPIGTAIFVGAIAFDTIGHRTAYKQALQENGEDLVHKITIFSGITSCILLCLAYSYPIFLRIPIYVFVVLSVFYSVIDEALHWHRYLHRKSDPVEMWSHFFIFVGHNIFVFSWLYWFEQGYPGVEATLKALHS